jgi:hypothetical protein
MRTRSYWKPVGISPYPNSPTQPTRQAMRVDSPCGGLSG